ncbi:MAG: protein kinase [Clostridiales Family XIII bacterium]|jgi:serine/threonine protein kinase|nr:protein kinase [Clostridiales Family XIII bacterium]
MTAMRRDFCPNCFAASQGGDRCGKCGYTAIKMPQSDMALRVGTILDNQYMTGRILGFGGFGVTYVAKDLQAGAIRAIKEYFPSALAARTPDGRVTAGKAGNKAPFEHGLSVFENEATLLREFLGEERIVQVYNRFFENGTAYFVMEYLDGLNVRALARNTGGAIQLDFAVEILRNTAEALCDVHGRGFLHRDVSPENIFLTKDGRIKLIDFGATRYFVGELSKSLSIILKPGFAPPEQYSGKGKQGPWTDVYALAATFYNIVSGQRLPEAPDRLSGKPLPRLHEIASGVNAATAEVIDTALKLNYKDRFQDMRVFLNAVDAALGQSAPPFADEDRAAGLKPGLVANVGSNPCISVVRGPFKGNKWAIPKNMDILIGRSSELCNIVIDDLNISRKHCRIRYDAQRNLFYIMDMSSNGTFDASGNRYDRDGWTPLSPEGFFYLSTADFTIRTGLE